MLPRTKTWSNRKQRKVLQSKGMLRQAKKRGFSTILARWQEQESYRSSLKDHDIGEQEAITIDLLWRDMIIQPQKLNEWDTLKIRFSLWMLKGNNHLDNYAQITKKQNENVNDYKTNSWKQICSSLQPSTQRESDYVVDRKTGWKSKKEQHGDMPHTSSSSSTSWQDSTWQWKSWWWHSSQYHEQWMSFFQVSCQCMLNSRISDCRSAEPTFRRGCTQNSHAQRAWRSHFGSRSWLLSCIIFVRLMESIFSSAMSHPCWSFPDYLTSSPSQHAALSGPLDLHKTTLYTDNHFRKNLFSLFQNSFLMSPHQQTQRNPVEKQRDKNTQILNMRVPETCASTPAQIPAMTSGPTFHPSPARPFPQRNLIEFYIRQRGF